MNEVALIFPNQLFLKSPIVSREREIFLIEEKRFFCDFRFHKNKLVLHRSSMKYYEEFLTEQGLKVNYIPFTDDYFEILKNNNINKLHIIDVVDLELEKKLKNSDFKIIWYSSPSFLTAKESFEDFFKDKKTYSQTSFYIEQRKKLKILVDSKSKPLGGKWSFDPENRRKIPSGVAIPKLITYGKNKYVVEAQKYVDIHFANNYGAYDDFIYPIMHSGAQNWLQDFLKNRLNQFGDYEDAILRDESYLFHSVLSYAINIGLITPDEILKTTIDFAKENKPPLNSLEGFIRQILGWREYIKNMYLLKGEKQISLNFWNHKKKMPACFYTGETGIEPIDCTIKKLLKTGYNHHIERLMILGNFMLLCEIAPQEIYKWFMEMYIDAYDWVMLPNVFGMSQFADGGMMMTKPYFSSSKYIKKMSNFPQEEWAEIWDALFWRFLYKNREKLEKIPREKLITRQLDLKSYEQIKNYMNIAENFLKKIDE